MDIAVDQVCRICLKDAVELKPIFDYEFEQTPIIFIMKKICYNIRFNFDENLPRNLCCECIDVLCRAHKLIEICGESEIKLKSLMSSEVFVKEESFEVEALDEALDPNIKIEDDLDIDDETFEQTVESLDDAEEEEEEDADPESSDDTKTKPQVSKKHKCPTCFKHFEKPSKLTRHLKTHDVNKKPFACEHPGCYQRFLTDASLKRHAILHSGMTIQVKDKVDKTFECIVCFKNFGE